MQQEFQAVFDNGPCGPKCFCVVFRFQNSRQLQCNFALEEKPKVNELIALQVHR